MSIQMVDGTSGEALSELLDSGVRLALDCEAAGFHRYSDRLCLLQVTVGPRTALIDPLAFDPTPWLRGPLEDPTHQVVMHGSDYDLRLLDRDLGIHPRNIFDTQVAAGLLGEPAIGLSALLEAHFGVRLSKKYQRADWAQRPLSEPMLAYAASDTQHLLDLADLLSERLEARGRLAWAQEEFGELEDIRWAPDEGLDPVGRVKGAKELAPQELQALRGLLALRDTLARAADRAPFRVVDDRTLLVLVSDPPASVKELESMKGMSRSLAVEHGPQILALLEEARQVQAADIEPFPLPARRGPGRPSPEMEERFEVLKRARNQAAEGLGIDRGILLPNAVLMDIARTESPNLEALAAVPSLKEWQLQAAGDALIRALKGP